MKTFRSRRCDEPAFEPKDTVFISSDIVPENETGFAGIGTRHCAGPAGCYEDACLWIPSSNNLLLPENSRPRDVIFVGSVSGF